MESQPEINWIEELQVISLKPGDILVIKSNKILTTSIYENIKSYFKSHFPQNEVVIFEPGMDLGVILRKEG